MKNLTPFKKGEVANPTGRPKGSVNLITKLREKLEELSKGERQTFAELFIESLVIDGIRGNDTARKLVMAYLEGMPKQNLKVEHAIPQNLIDLIKQANGITQQATIAEVPGENPDRSALVLPEPAQPEVLE